MYKRQGKSTTLSDIEKRSLGEAYFTRGWAHFLIAYRYGLDTQGAVSYTHLAPVCATASRLRDTCAEARDEVALRPEWMRILHDTLQMCIRDSDRPLRN